tara:strand:+ start:4453 stop:4731 length:279 start_codon:yes stop_codon:yes gene_type:complete
MKDSRLKKYGLKKFNVAKRTPNHPTKSHVVYAKVGKKTKLIRFGQQGIKGSPPKKNESLSSRKRRMAFRKRHAKNINNRFSGAYWSNKIKWS